MDIICLQSLDAARHKLPPLNGFCYPPASVALGEMRGELRVRSCIYVRVGITVLGSGVWDAPLPEGAYASSLSLLVEEQTINLLNVYSPGPIADFDWMDACVGSEWVIVGDFNCRDALWEHGYPCTKVSHKLAIESGDLVLLNDGSFTRIPNVNQSPSVVDLSFVSASLAGTVKWQVEDDPLGSDHLPILLSFTIPSVAGPAPRPPRYLYEKADWALFRSYLDHVISAHTSSPDPEQEIATLTRFILEAADFSIPKSGGSSHPRPVPWWNRACGDAIKAKRRALNTFRRTRSAEDLLLMREAAGEAKRQVAAAKREYLVQRCSSGSLEAAWKGLKRLKGTWRPTERPLVTGDTRYSTDTEKAEAYRDYSETLGTTANLPQEIRDARNPALLTLDPPGGVPFFRSGRFTERDLSLAVLKTGSGTSAPGPDGVTNLMIKRLSTSFRLRLLDVFNSCWSSHLFPQSWRRSIVVPIPKKGKDRSKVQNYRPISLTSCLGKLYERLVKPQIERLCRLTGALPPSQAGFRAGRSTTDHCVALAEQLRRARARGRVALACFYDLTRAFDSVWHAKVIERLTKLGASPEILGFATSFLANRSFQVRWGNSLSTTGRTDMGVPQGSVVSPLLFIILLKDPGAALEGSSLVSSFADDVCLYRNTFSKRSTRVRQRLRYDLASFQRDSDSVVAYLESLGFQINTDKTVFMIFNARPLDELRLCVNGAFLSPQRRVTYLGVVFSYNLSWEPHTDHLVSQAIRGVYLVRAAAGEPWGRDRAIGVTLTMSLVRSRLVYGLEAARDIPPSLLRRLVACECSALRQALGLPNGTPTLKVYKEAGVLPLSCRLGLSRASYFLRALASEGPTRDEILDEHLWPWPRGVRGKYPSLETETRPWTGALGVDPLQLAPPPAVPMAPGLVSFPGHQYRLGMLGL